MGPMPQAPVIFMTKQYPSIFKDFYANFLHIKIGLDMIQIILNKLTISTESRYTQCTALRCTSFSTQFYKIFRTGHIFKLIEQTVNIKLHIYIEMRQDVKFLERVHDI